MKGLFSISRMMLGVICIIALGGEGSSIKEELLTKAVAAAVLLILVLTSKKRENERV